MLHSKLCNKDTNEDPKTSSVLENLLLLPDNEFWEMLRSSCQNNDALPSDAGLIEEYEFWPKWNPKGTTNTNYVEPDVFLRFQKLDIIIEAKVGDTAGQHQDQWDNEYIAYLNEYKTEGHEAVLIALGGNATMEEGQANDCGRNKSTKVLRCSWIGLRNEVTKCKDNLVNQQDINEASARKRLLNNIMLAFSLHNISEVHWLDELCNNPIEIRQSSINDIKAHFQTRKSWAKN